MSVKINGLITLINDKQVAYSLALVFVIVGLGPSRSSRKRLAGLLDQLFAGLVQAYQHLMFLELAMIDLQHVLS